MTEKDAAPVEDEFAERLDGDGPEATLSWLGDVLSREAPMARSRHCLLLAFTGQKEALKHLELLVDSPVTQDWGSAAALLGASWSLVSTWLSRGGPHRLMALDALLACRSPTPNMAPFAQIAAPVLEGAPSRGELEKRIDLVASDRPSARILRSVQLIKSHAEEILGRSVRGVPVEDLPTLFLTPERVPGSRAVLERHQAALATMDRSISDLLSRLAEE